MVKICVSGAADTGHCGLDAFDKARETGREIARHGAIITTGATTGFPLYAAMGAKDESGFSIGFLPLQLNASMLKHTNFRLSTWM